MWTLRVAVAVGGIGVDANLRILQLRAPVSLKLLTGSEEWLDDRRTRGVAKLREETSRRGAIPVGARGGLGVNRSADEISEMADRRDWGGGGEDPEESTQRMIERIWESLTDIRARMDQQAPVPPVAVPAGDGEAVPVAPVPPRVEVPFVAPVPPPPPVLIAEEPVMQVEKFLRLQPPTYSGGPNPDTVEHWVHEIERVFATMRCSAADKVVLAAYQLRGFALEWWRLKMQTTFAGRTEEAITWPEFLDVFNDTFFLIQVQQVKREQFRTLQQGEGEEDVSRPSSSSGPRRSSAGSVPPAIWFEDGMRLLQVGGKRVVGGDLLSFLHLHHRQEDPRPLHLYHRQQYRTDDLCISITDCEWIYTSSNRARYMNHRFTEHSDELRARSAWITTESYSRGMDER
ncbi:hypothetical protein Taro_017501 [Colocasia esculenta]|uniref:Retrotransposon gag domain-containing protein n=1 Tax=Colocasia esculenta TaxID=4460 RepID=A0A843UN95_COLES|nr:hypothetical protein [Colocasia esculenta]